MSSAALPLFPGNVVSYCLQHCCLPPEELRNIQYIYCASCSTLCWQGNHELQSSKCLDYCRMTRDFEIPDNGTFNTATNTNDDDDDKIRRLQAAVIVLAIIVAILIVVIIIFVVRLFRGTWQQSQTQLQQRKPNHAQQAHLQQHQQQNDDMQDKESLLESGSCTESKTESAAVTTNGRKPLVCYRTDENLNSHKIQDAESPLILTPSSGAPIPPTGLSRYTRLDMDAGSICETLTDDEFHDAWSPGTTPAHTGTHFSSHHHP